MHLETDQEARNVRSLFILSSRIHFTRNPDSAAVKLIGRINMEQGVLQIGSVEQDVNQLLRLGLVPDQRMFLRVIPTYSVLIYEFNP